MKQIMIAVICWLGFQIPTGNCQNNSVILDGAFINLDGGTGAENIYFFIDQSDTSGIVRTGNGGHISSEGQFNFVKWNFATNTGNYVFPFGVGGAVADYIPFTFNKTSTSSSSISMSTWTTNPQNMPHPLQSNVATVSNMLGIPDSVKNALDRFWDIQVSAPVTADLTFSYRGSENTTLVPDDTIKAQHWNGTFWEPQVGPGNPGITTGIGTVGPIYGQTTFSPWVLSVEPIICDEEDIRLTNVFSPNGDGVNDVFLIGGICPDDKFSLRIFNRWGAPVYYTTLRNAAWNGRTSAGLECEDGVYYYLTTVNLTTYKGFVHLLR